MRNRFNVIPFFFKIIMFIMLSIVTTVIFYPKIINALINNPYFTINKFELWRLFSTVFLTMNPLNCLLQIFVLFKIMQLLEKQISTIITIIDFFFMNFLIQLIFSLFSEVIYSIQPTSVNNIYSFGVLPINFVYLARSCYVDPQGYVRILCFPPLKKKYCPLLLILMVLIIFDKFQFDIYIAYLLTSIQYRFFKGSLLKLPKCFYVAIQKSFLCCMFRERTDFFKIENCIYSRFFMTQQIIQPENTNLQNNVEQINSTESQIDSFQQQISQQNQSNNQIYDQSTTKSSESRICSTNSQLKQQIIITSLDLQNNLLQKNQNCDKKQKINEQIKQKTLKQQII